ncbi:MAG: IclR family transcriptional regulator [Firmicutes bacterium]|nr:IclR family transcriptional regulator [Bacillota bacterium]
MQLVERVAVILRVLCQFEYGLGVKEASTVSGIPRSSVYRILTSLVEEGLVVKDPVTKQYRLGPALLGLAMRMLNNMEIRTAALPYLRELKDRLKETVVLTVLQGNECVCVDKVDGEPGLRYFASVGTRLPVHASAASKAILAFVPDNRVGEVVAACDFTRFTRFTPTDRESFFRELEETRNQGYALSVEHLENGVNSLAVPVFGASGQAVASICLLGPTSRLTPEFVGDALPRMKEVAAKISAAIGVIP